MPTKGRKSYFLKKRTKKRLLLAGRNETARRPRAPAATSQFFLLHFFKKEVLFFFVFPSCALAQSPIWQAVQARAWPLADMLARQSPDPLAAKLVRYQRLLAPNQAPAQEIADFIAENPSWPQLPTLRRRLSDAVAAITDDAAARTICEAYAPTGADALARCAAAARAGGHTTDADNLAREAWAAGLTNPAVEAAFLATWSGAIDAATDGQRFDRLAWANDPAATRQLLRVDPARRALAAARLALRHNDQTAAAALAAVPQAQRTDPTLLLEQARWLRGNDDDAGALALWRTAGAAAEPAAPAERRGAFWTERERLARALLAANDADGAYFLANDTSAGPDQAPDAFFLAGWIALRKLHQTSRATAHFQALATVSPAVITQGRAYYWLGRAAENDAAAKIAFTRAAAFPTSFYGQLAAARLDGAATARIRALPDPPLANGASPQFDAAELVHAATLLLDWGDRADAARFLLRHAGAHPDATTAELTARRAIALDLPDVAVQVARLAGKSGIALPHLGWPDPCPPPPGPDADLILGIIRQESSFAPTVASGAGAVGLMQLMPGTARRIQPGVSTAALTDPGTNMRIGIAYLESLLEQFNNFRPYAAAAYNAGPRHVREWIAANGDAEQNEDAMVDWIEQIPFGETRNYVQRVLEGAAIYRAFATP
jgi:soluble lytic murein transglycosylase